MRKAEIKDGKIILSGEEKQIISGAIHYFRVHPGLWDDRLDKAVAFGLNTVETYIPWNIHEPYRGQFNFSGIADVESFIEKVHARGLNMILRPGPYICAEWENGGFPAWLLNVPGVKLRRMNRPYLQAVTDYFNVLLEKLSRWTYTNGGPVIMMQVENEYGSYCHDKEYLNYLKNLFRNKGIDIPLFTSDGSFGHYMVGGTLPDVTMTLNFGSGTEEAFRNGREFRPEGPDFCMEFWNGWFDHWGEKHHVRPDDASAELEKMLAMGANVNFYMFHGGTNFGFTNGANGNFSGMYDPTVTSYDYDCPLSECGDPTPKFRACQAVIKKYTDNPAIRDIAESKKICPAPVKLTASTAVLDNLSVLQNVSGKSHTAPTMEELDETFGFVHYRSRINGPLPEGEPLRLINVNDFVQVWLDGKYMGSRWRDNGSNGFIMPAVPAEGAQVDVLVENCGRINYGPLVGKDVKGVQGAVAVELMELLYWDYSSLPMKELSGLTFGEYSDTPATFHKGEFELEETGEAFLEFPGVKGLVWVNGFNLGRYWEKGPTETLYIPSPVLKKGKNEIIVLELEKLKSGTLTFSPIPKLGATE